MTAPDELLPCPFCGGQPIRSMSAPYIVGCVSKRCPAYANVTGDSMSNATANWNRRYIRAPDSAEFCKHCGAGIGKFRRVGEGTCHRCDPPDSAPNGLADDATPQVLQQAIAAAQNSIGEGKRFPTSIIRRKHLVTLIDAIARLTNERDAQYDETCEQIRKAAALRNQPGGAVPRRPTPAMIVAGANVDPPCSAGEAMSRWTAMHDAATKAGEGETPATDERERG